MNISVQMSSTTLFYSFSSPSHCSIRATCCYFSFIAFSTIDLAFRFFIRIMLDTCCEFRDFYYSYSFLLLMNFLRLGLATASISLSVSSLISTPLKFGCEGRLFLGMS